MPGILLTTEKTSAPAMTHDMPSLPNALPEEVPPGRGTECPETQTEGATAKVNVILPYNLYLKEKRTQSPIFFVICLT